MQGNSSTLTAIDEPQATAPSASRQPSILDCWPIAAYTLIAVALLAWRLHWTDTSGHLSLPWDLLLGWTPLLFAWLLHRIVSRPARRDTRWWRRLAILS